MITTLILYAEILVTKVNRFIVATFVRNMVWIYPGSSENDCTEPSTSVRLPWPSLSGNFTTRKRLIISNFPLKSTDRWGQNGVNHICKKRVIVKIKLTVLLKIILFDSRTLQIFTINIIKMQRYYLQNINEVLGLDSLAWVKRKGSPN
jgi:hypothetical protein